MPVVKVDDLNLALFTERVELSCRCDAPTPHLVYTKVQMASAVNSDKHDVILSVFLALGVLSLSVGKLVLAGLPVEHVIKVVVQLGTWTVEVDKDAELFLIK